MKNLTFFLLFIVFLTSLKADVQLDWFGSVKDSLGNDAPTSYWVQLIWSPDASVDAFDPNDPLAPTNGEIILNGATVTDQGEFLMAEGFVFGSPNYTDPYRGIAQLDLGWAYTRVFSSDNPTIGSFYGETATVDLEAFSAPSTGITDHNFGTINVDQLIAIPEPSSVMMIAIAFVTLLGMRRRFRG